MLKEKSYESSVMNDSMAFKLKEYLINIKQMAGYILVLWYNQPTLLNQPYHDMHIAFKISRIWVCCAAFFLAVKFKFKARAHYKFKVKVKGQVEGQVEGYD